MDYIIIQAGGSGTRLKHLTTNFWKNMKSWGRRSADHWEDMEQDFFEMTGAMSMKSGCSMRLSGFLLQHMPGRIMILSAAHFTTDYIIWRMCYDSLL